MSTLLNRLLSTRYETPVSGFAGFETGQVWRISGGEFNGVTLLVVKTEYHPTLGAAVHVSINGPLTIGSQAALDGIPHLPFTPEALEISDLEPVGFVSEQTDNWQDMYSDWADDAHKGDAGLFSLSVSEILGTIMAKLAWLD
ncbi:MAG: hypothetical protein CMK07_09775 [Ponticaulis sp.]|nr:hypothetical protein [Ponticaulis sp.]